MKTPIPSAIGYVRVSTLEQANEGISLDAQRERVQLFCKSKGWKLLKICRDEGISGRKMHNRPGLLDAIAIAKQHRCPLIIYSLSRFARSTRDCLELSEQLRRGHADLISISESIDTTSAAGKFFFIILAALAQFESDQSGERVRMAMAHLRSQGVQWTRYPPYGYRFKNRKLTMDPREQRLLHLACRLRRRQLPYAEICRRLTRLKFFNRAERAFTPAQIGVLILRYRRWLDVGAKQVPVVKYKS